MTPALEVSGLGKRYGAPTAVEDLAFSVAPGEVLGLIGPNGDGKTTASMSAPTSRTSTSYRPSAARTRSRGLRAVVRDA